MRSCGLIELTFRRTLISQTLVISRMSIVIPTDVRGRTALNFHVTNSPSPDFLPDHYFFGFFVARSPQLVKHIARWWHYRAVTLLVQPRVSSAHEYRRGAAGMQNDTAYGCSALHESSIVASNVFEFDQKNVRRVDIGRDAFSSSKFRPHLRVTKRGRNRRQRASKLLARIRRSCSLYSTTPSAVGASPGPTPARPRDRNRANPLDNYVAKVIMEKATSWRLELQNQIHQHNCQVDGSTTSSNFKHALRAVDVAKSSNGSAILCGRLKVAMT
jgi:hypothetical protein